jgi:hypothetical protein
MKGGKVMRKRTIVAASALILTAGAVTAAQAMVVAHSAGFGRVHVAGRDTIQRVNVTGGTGSTKLAPDGPVTLFGTFDNPNHYGVEVHTLHATVSQVLGAPGDCPASAFRIVDPVEPTDPAKRWVVPAQGTFAWKGGSIEMINDATHDPIGCMGATVILGFEAS